MKQRECWLRDWSRNWWLVSVVVVPLHFAACEQAQPPTTPAEALQPGQALGAAPLRQFAHNISSPTPLETILVNETVAMPVTIKNISPETWPATGEKPVYVSYRWVDMMGRGIGPTIPTPLPHHVAPGESVLLEATVQAPAETGEYILRLTLVQENVAWFDQRGAQPLNLPVTVTASETTGRETKK
jgi:hypothetical protein